MLQLYMPKLLCVNQTYISLLQTPCLDYLDIQSTVWTEPAIQFFGRALRLDCPLAVLHMENCNLSGRPLFLLGEVPSGQGLFQSKWHHSSCDHEYFSGSSQVSGAVPSLPWARSRVLVGAGLGLG